MVIPIEKSDQGVLVELGDRLAQQRLKRNLTQDQLAREAGVSKRTIVRLERGQSSQMTNFIRVLRALGLLGNMDALIPGSLTSPIAALKHKARQRHRVATAGRKPAPRSAWTWGDDRPTRRGEP